MNDDLGTRVYREYCWFAAVLLAVLVGAIVHVAERQPAGPHTDSPAAARF